MSLLPDEVATLPVCFRGARDVQAVAGLVVGLFFADSAARAAKVDPGKPGVPAFGRKLYHLKPKSVRPRQADINRAAAVRRKRGQPEDPRWMERYQYALDKINAARYEALVLDYDGTLCETRARTGPLNAVIAEELTRLAEAGAIVGLATGRGPSAGIELRASIPARLHDRVLVGYYNCAVIRFLTDRQDPVVSCLDPEHRIVMALEKDPMLRGSVRSNAVQISTGVRRGLRVEDAVAEVRLLMRANRVKGDVVISGHSIDLCLAGQSKDDLLNAMREAFDLGDGPILRIGDRGRPPGNDWKLLDDPHGLSVDEVSAHPVHCWSLAPAGNEGHPSHRALPAAIALVNGRGTASARSRQAAIGHSRCSGNWPRTCSPGSWTGRTPRRRRSASDSNASRRTNTINTNSLRRAGAFLRAWHSGCCSSRRARSEESPMSSCGTDWCSSRTKR